MATQVVVFLTILRLFTLDSESLIPEEACGPTDQRTNGQTLFKKCDGTSEAVEDIRPIMQQRPFIPSNIHEEKCRFLKMPR